MAKILITDDSPTVLAIISRSLQKEGYDVVTASSGEEAFEKTISEQPDLILMDVTLPMQSGYEVCRKIKDDYRLKKIPVIFLTGKNPEEEKRQFEESKGNAFLAKPVDMEKLFETIETFLSETKNT
ncbi:MAG: response regulator [Candidatus Omnitrophica bacterium]|nr:response regulator [Candidatus Omnitrophota bacterium]